MKLPSLAQAREHLLWNRAETVAWWIEQCSGTPEEMSNVAYTLQFEWLGYKFFDLDGLLKEVVRPLVHGSAAIRREISCQDCGMTGCCIVAHHIHYQRPLDVCWLCGRCHSRIHAGGASWLDDEAVLDPGCRRQPGSFSTQRFPLLDALWKLREELEPLRAERLISLQDEVFRSIELGRDPGRSAEKPIDPAVVVLRRAAERGWKVQHMLEMIQDCQSPSVT